MTRRPFSSRGTAQMGQLSGDTRVKCSPGVAGVFFSKLARTLLRGIRADSREDLAARIIRHLEALNDEPVVFRWKYQLDQIEAA